MKKISSLFTFLIILVFVSFTKGIAVTQLEIHFIDVGQADSIFFVLPNGEHMLIDAGNNDDGQLVVNYLTSHGVTRIDYLVGTHPHEDHIGGLDNVINAFTIGKVYLPNVSYSTQTYQDVLNAIAAKNLTITTARAGVSMFSTTANNLPLNALIVSPSSSSYSDINNYSAVIKLTYGTTNYLLTGDAGTIPENEMIASSYNLQANVLKVGHHGSSTSTSQAFLNEVQPQSAVICVGADNPYGHPHQETLDRLAANNVTVYRTDLLGTILLTSNGTSITINGDTNNPPVETANLFINEILPAPSTGSEWVELYNPGNTAIDLSGYIIDDIANGGGAPVTIPNGTTIAAHGFYIQYFTNYFNNTGDDIRLLAPNQTIIDSHTYGSSSYNMSWYRVTDGGNWSTSQTNTPTPNASNSSTVTATIVINELLPAPKNTYTREWVELYNPGNTAVDISGYVVDDIEGGSTPYTIPQGTTISAKGYYIIYFTNVFNNSGGDSVRLFTNTGTLIDSFSYTTVSYDKSWYRYPSGGSWSTTMDSSPTPNGANQ